MRLWALLVLWCLSSAQAGEPTTQPLLRLETGMHMAPNIQIATDAAGRWAVTASHDKTARIWNVASGEPVGVLRVPQDAGDEGKLYAVAMSPDGEKVAVGGWTGGDWDQQASIYLFDRATQRLLRRISGLPNVIHKLAYSPDGRWLAAGLGGNSGVLVFDPTSSQEIGRDSDYGSEVHSVEFSPSVNTTGLRLLSTSIDGKMRIHAVEAGRLTRLKEMHLGGGKLPGSARFSPDGRWIAVGFHDSHAVQVLDAQTLNEQVRLGVPGMASDNLAAVAWSADGRSLVAAGRWVDMNDKRPMGRWSVGNWSRLGDVPLSGDTVMDLVALPKAAGGGWLFASQDPVWGVVNAQGQVVRRREGRLADFRAQHVELHLSADGRQLRFGYEMWGKAPYGFDTSRRELTPETASTGAVLNGARIEAQGLAVTDWVNSTAPTLNGKPIKLDRQEISRSLAITPDGQRFALGADWRLRFFDRTGKKLWQQSAPGPVWAINISADVRWVVAAYGDGTIRWHRIEDGKEVLAFFPHADRKRWVLWTPEGYYDASPDAEDLIGYHLNHGKDQAGEFVNASQLRETFYQPNLISQRLGPQGDELMQQAVAKRGDVRELLRAGTMPVLVLESAAVIDRLDGYRPVLRIQNAGQGAGRLILRIDGSELDGRRVGSALSPGRRVELDPLPLTSDARKVTVELVDDRGIASKPIEIPVKVADNTRAAAAREEATLHVLAVGVTEYHDADLRLKYAARDAEAIADRFRQRGGALFKQRVKVTALTDARATVANIEATLKAMAAKARPNDTFVLYMAGHGTMLADSGEYHFLPHELVYENDQSISRQAVSQSRLRTWMSWLPVRSLLLLDTCRAGNVVQLASRAGEEKGAFASLIRLSNRAVIVASSSDKMALEGYKDHGVFSWVVLDALDNADYDNNGQVDVTDIATHVRRLVPEITEKTFKYRQVPMQDTPGDPFAVAQPVGRGAKK